MKLDKIREELLQQKLYTMFTVVVLKNGFTMEDVREDKELVEYYNHLRKKAVPSNEQLLNETWLREGLKQGFVK